MARSDDTTWAPLSEPCTQRETRYRSPRVYRHVVADVHLSLFRVVVGRLEASVSYVDPAIASREHPGRIPGLVGTSRYRAATETCPQHTACSAPRSRVTRFWRGTCVPSRSMDRPVTTAAGQEDLEAISIRHRRRRPHPRTPPGLPGEGCAQFLPRSSGASSCPRTSWSRSWVQDAVRRSRLPRA
jgi:hypothetical protein